MSNVLSSNLVSSAFCSYLLYVGVIAYTIGNALFAFIDCTVFKLITFSNLTFKSSFIAANASRSDVKVSRKQEKQLKFTLKITSIYCTYKSHVLNGV